MPPIKEYTISISDSKIVHLKKKLEATDFPTDLEDAGWQYGSPIPDIKKFHSHWLNDFDWRAHERRMNELPNFDTQINVDGFGSMDMHFVHQKSGIEGAIPLLFVHGWPGSFMEVSNMLPLLKGGDDGKGGKRPAFNVVAPSLPSYGFSGRVTKVCCAFR